MWHSRAAARPAPAVSIALIAASALAMTGCVSAEPDQAAGPTPSFVQEDVVVDTSTIRTIIDSPAQSPTLALGDPLEPIAGEHSVSVSYDSGDLTVTGVIRRPSTEGPAPAILFVHGGVNTETYETGGDIIPLQQALLNAGYVVFAVDLRGYADSDPADPASPAVDPGFGWMTVLDWGMALDVVNGLRLLRTGQVEGVDTDRIGLLGHSMGGLLALDAAVIAPGLADFVVSLSAPSSDFGALITELAEHGEADELLASPWAPQENPQYWVDVSPLTFFDRATEPLLLVHGGADTTALPEWSVRTAEAWRAAGNHAEAVIIDGADHHFAPKFAEAEAVVLNAFEAALRD